MLYNESFKAYPKPNITGEKKTASVPKSGFELVQLKVQNDHSRVTYNK